MEFEIIKASPADTEELLDFSRLFNGDYLEYVLDRWLSQETGGVYLIRHGETLVACCCLSFPSVNEGWLQGMRVHPHYRRRGIASLLTAHLAGLAKTKGIVSIRLLTNPGNQQAQRLASKAGFSIRGPIREVIYLEQSPDSSALAVQPKSAWQRCRSGDLEQVMNHVYRSSRSPVSEDLFFCPGYMFRALTESSIRTLIENEAVYYLSEGGAHWQGLAIFLKDPLHSHLLCAYINTSPGGLSAFSSILPVLNINQYRYFSISMLQEQHQLLRPILNQLLGDYECEPWVVMELTGAERN